MKIQTNDPKYPKDAELLNIVLYPDPVLKTLAKPVEIFNDEIKFLCQNMLKTMYNAPGIGLAAPQIGLSHRIFVLDVDYDREALENDTYEIKNLNPIVFINPALEDLEGETTYQEGCLSIPGIFDDVKRAKTLKVKYQDENGNHHSMPADDLLSICIQHENDHLDGVLFIEKLSNLKFNLYKKKMIKEKKRLKASE